MKKPKAKPKLKAAKPAPPPRKPRPVVTEHRIAVASVAVLVAYGRSRVEQFELRGTATVNAGAPDGIVRTTGFAALASGRGAKGASRVAYTPGSLDRNLVLTLFVDEADLALLREIFVTGTGPEGSDPGLTFWARTARPLKTDTADAQPVTEFGYRLDFDPGSL